MSEGKLLGSIHSPEDLKKLPMSKLETLAAEIRYELITTVSRTGGHLASNLGMVELTIALHRIFESPKDRMVFDVGHQCYTHKLLTGRGDRFSTLRQSGGLSGFPKRSESIHDAFLAGHSSTSISLAMGMAKAMKLQGQPGKAIAVIGDGAFSGLAFEALNNIDASLDNLIIVLNDNEMSISRNVTTFAHHLAKIRNTNSYYVFKDGLERTLKNIPLVGKPLRSGVSAVKSAAKDFLYHTNLFEDMGLTYLGPVEGHNLIQLCATLRRAKKLREPVLIHVHTQKGKGYTQAEANPGAFHGVAKFDPREQQPNVIPQDSFSEHMGLALTELGEKDKEIVAITAAMKYATGLHHFSTRFRPDGRFFDVGIAESHATVFAAAMAAGGMKPVFCVYSSFLQRAFDQLLHDCSLESAHVVLGVDRAGLVGEDGETHQGLFDVSMLTALPGAVVYSPATYAALERDLQRALYEEKGLTAVRYPRGKQTYRPPEEARDHGDYCTVGQGKSLLVTYGRVVQNAAQALEQSGKSADYTLVLLDRIFPLPQGALALAAASPRVVFVEEAARCGGIGEHFGCALDGMDFSGRFVLRAIENPVVPQGTVAQCMQAVGLDAASLAELL